MKSKEIFNTIFKNIDPIIKSRESTQITNIIMENFFKCNQIDIIKNTEINITQNTLKNLIKKLQNRLSKNEPIQHITKKQEFLDCTIFVNRHVLIPRQETEEMVFNILQNDLKNKKIIDICSGSGCIGISIKKKINTCEMTCLDISKKAIKISKKSAKYNDVNIKYLNLDIFSEKINTIDTYDVMISNPPYIPISEKKNLEKKISFEPDIALFVKSNNPLKFYNQLNTIIQTKLNKGGMFFLEINENFANDIILILRNENIKNLKINKDLNNKDRWISGEKI